MIAFGKHYCLSCSQPVSENIRNVKIFENNHLRSRITDNAKLNNVIHSKSVYSILTFTSNKLKAVRNMFTRRRYIYACNRLYLKSSKRNIADEAGMSNITY